MLNWKDQFVESANNKCIFINRNGVYQAPKGSYLVCNQHERTEYCQYLTTV